MYFLVLLILLLSGLVKSVVSSLSKFYTSNLHQNNALEYSLQWYWSTMDDKTFYILVVVYIQLTLKKINTQLNFDHKSLVEIKIFIIWKNYSCERLFLTIHFHSFLFRNLVLDGYNNLKKKPLYNLTRGNK